MVRKSLWELPHFLAGFFASAQSSRLYDISDMEEWPLSRDGVHPALV